MRGAAGIKITRILKRASTGAETFVKNDIRFRQTIYIINSTLLLILHTTSPLLQLHRPILKDDTNVLLISCSNVR